MGQQAIVNHAKHATRKNYHNGRRYRSSRQHRSSSQLLFASKMIVVGAAAVFILISIYTNLTSLQFFWLELMPSLWRLMCGLFTPRNLFIVLNLLILSILALAHLHNSTSTRTLRSAAVNHSHDQHSISDHDYSRVKLKDADRVDGGADDLQQGGSKFDDDHAKLHSGAGQSHEMKLIKDDDRADNADQFANDARNHALKCWKEDDNHDDEAMATAASAAAGLVMKEVIPESTSHVQLSAVYSVEVYCSRDAEGEAGKASQVGGKATSAEADWQGLAGVDDKLIDSLLSEEGSIFTRAESRPLTSARFTRKKGTSTANHDQQLSPLRISKPILKRGETLEATWKAICESKRQSSPFNCHYSKHRTSERIHDDGKLPRSSFRSPIKQRSKAASRLQVHELTRAQVMRKSREPSMPNEELNSKVESFISRFNAQIKIQREKSLLDYMEMVGRGAS